MLGTCASRASETHPVPFAVTLNIRKVPSCGTLARPIEAVSNRETKRVYGVYGADKAVFFSGMIGKCASSAGKTHTSTLCTRSKHRYASCGTLARPIEAV